LGEGFATHHGFMEAFRPAGVAPNVVMRVGNIFSLINLVSGGVGCSLLPDRARDDAGSSGRSSGGSSVRRAVASAIR
ncbi:LysR substrate-binding domain-containing protein, partial [Burkholderia cenocepacia]|uniref:LysR substrate-binding domain-containing protein n=1 Tax=Burkholderia cenocepacia TaxID=95486 RepID=UPI0024B79776